MHLVYFLPSIYEIITDNIYMSCAHKLKRYQNKDKKDSKIPTFKTLHRLVAILRKCWLCCLKHCSDS